jgi:hypothetical protein
VKISKLSCLIVAFKNANPITVKFFIRLGLAMNLSVLQIIEGRNLQEDELIKPFCAGHCIPQLYEHSLTFSRKIQQAKAIRASPQLSRMPLIFLEQILEMAQSPTDTDFE